MHVVNDGLFVGIYPLLPLVAAELGLSYAQVGGLKTAATRVVPLFVRYASGNDTVAGYCWLTYPVSAVFT